MAKETRESLLLYAIFTNNKVMAKQAIEAGCDIDKVLKNIKAGMFYLSRKPAYEYAINELRKQKLKKLL